MLDEKNGKMIIFGVWNLESLLQRHVAFKGLGGYWFNYRFHGLDGFATEKILPLRSEWIQIRSIRLIRSLFSLGLV